MQTHHDAAETMCLKIVPPGNENNRASYESRLPPLTCEPYMLWTDEEQAFTALMVAMITED